MRNVMERAEENKGSTSFGPHEKQESGAVLLLGGGASGQARRCVCRHWWSDTHNGFRLAAGPLSGGFWDRRAAIPVNR